MMANPTVLSTDPIDAYIDPSTGDITPTGDIVQTTGIAAVVQGASIRLKMFAGEWFLNLDQGVPYLEREGVTATKALLGQKFNLTKAIRAFRDQLLGTDTISGVPGIISLIQLNAVWNNTTRTLNIIWQAQTAFGDTPINTLAVGV